MLHLLQRSGAATRGLFAAVAMAVLPPQAGAAPVAPLAVAVSGTGVSPFAGCTSDLIALQHGLGEVDYPNSEVEPYIAVNPSNPRNLIAVWQQDRWKSTGSRGNVAGVSFDGGESWQVVTATRSSACSGNPIWVRASDPWVTFSPDGTAFFMHLVLYSLLLPFPDLLYSEAMEVVRSEDGGLTWGTPTVLVGDASPTMFHDKGSITADPNDGQFVYAIWDELTGPPSGNDNPTAALHAEAIAGRTLFSRSTDGGTSWEPVLTVLNAGTQNGTVGHQIVVRPSSVGGELVDVFALVYGKKNSDNLRGANVAVQTSSDRGATWSAPVVVSSMITLDTVDPNTGFPVRTGRFPDAAVDPTNGNVFAVWEDARFSGGAYDDVAVAMSPDGGRHWIGPIALPRGIADGVAGPNRQAFTPQVHVSADGRLAVGYYDFRNNNGAGDATQTDYFVAQCARPAVTGPTLCATGWRETRVTNQSFDLRAAPVTDGGLFLGDYTGLTDVPGGFGSAFTRSGLGDPATTYFTTVPFTP
jgi:hypothetical protein